MNVNPNTNSALKLLLDGSLALCRAEQAGIHIDVEYAEKKKLSLTKKIEIIEQTFRETEFYKEWKKSLGGKTPNINSGTQLSTFLFKVKKYKSLNSTTSGRESADEEALTQLNIPELTALLKAKKLKKIRDTYLESYLREQVDGVIHPSFSLHLVKTYRSGVSMPNVQNIPKRDKLAMQICRSALFARPDHQLLEIDFSGAEIRIASCYHKDPNMLKFLTDKTSDMHSELAKQLFLVDNFDKKLPEHNTLRQAAKSFIFAEFYGDYFKNCAESLAVKWGKLNKGKWKAGQGVPMPEGTLSDHLISKGIKSYDAFEKHVQRIEEDFWGNRFKVYASWKEKWWKMYQKKGYVDFLNGFRCSGLMSKNECINFPIQGTSFLCLLWTLIRTDEIMRMEKWDSRIVSQIHDSIIVDCNKDELEHVAKTIKHIIQVELPEHWPWINVPMDADAEVTPVNGSWSELAKYEI